MSDAAILRPAFPASPEPRCRECGCTENHACYSPALGPCAWAEDDLCTACEPLIQITRRMRRWRRAFWILLAAVLLFWTACFVDAWFSANEPASFEPAPPPPPSHQVASGSARSNPRNI